MDLELNPYRPGSGRTPERFAGREEEIKAFDLLIAKSKRNTPLYDRGLVFSGLRGVGKTVLLNYLYQHAKNKGWLCLQLEGKTQENVSHMMRARFSRDLYKAAQELKNVDAASFFNSVKDLIVSFARATQVSVGTDGVNSTWSMPDRAGSGELEIDLRELVEDICVQLKKTRSVLAIFIDEFQDLDQELVALLLEIQHFAHQRELPFYIFGAGLPTLPSVLAGARSYAERLFDYRTVGPLTVEEAHQALEDPARGLGVNYEPEAAAKIVEEASCYPYFIQQFGEAVWIQGEGKTITQEAAEAGLRSGWNNLNGGFFPARWDKLAKNEKEYLIALARRGMQAHTADIAEDLGRAVSAFSTIRSDLIKRGVIYAPVHGQVSFTVPGMNTFILQHPDAR